ncbi:MAG: tRNA pseudouridine65 synthase [Cyclobacteriaceae bacterium]|jgi:tRNA pseudouridine65 synthase
MQTLMPSLEILYKDEHIVAINKPHGLLVHRTKMAKDATEFALQQLRDQLGQPVYPAHRIDRKTGGILLFALNDAVNRQLQILFAERKMSKTYLSIVRGFSEDEGEIDYPLVSESGKTQESKTTYNTLAKAELNVPFGKHSTSRYSLVKVVPETGRMHQIRKHLAHILHPIIADRAHGCNKQNRLFKEKWAMDTMLLHAWKLSFDHPITSEKIEIKAELQSEFVRMMELMDFRLEEHAQCY